MNVRPASTGDNFWKWIAAVLMAILLTGAPPYVGLAWALLRAPSKDDVSLIRERQQIVLQRLAVIDDRSDANVLVIRDLRNQVGALQRQMDDLERQQFSGKR